MHNMPVHHPERYVLTFQLAKLQYKHNYSDTVISVLNYIMFF